MKLFKLITQFKSFSFAATLSSFLATILVSPAFAGGDLLLFGGKNYSNFLGCFTCGKFDTNSIDNEFGPYGSRFSNQSIFNKFGPYGSEFSSESACNPGGSYPPILVDEDRNIYGYLTVDISNPDAVKIPELQGLVVGMCRN